MAGFSIKPTRQLLQERGLLEGGKVQKFIDSECIRHMATQNEMLAHYTAANLIRR